MQGRWGAAGRHLLVAQLLLLCVVEVLAGVPPKSSNTTISESSRVKRGYSSGHSTGIAYNRIHDAGQVRLGGGRHGGGGGGHGDEDEGEGHGGGEGGSTVGEDGTHTTDFKSYGVGYEHRHGGHCEESKCGYNIRHCPHGCVFNSLLCGGGRAYDTCCC